MQSPRHLPGIEEIDRYKRAEGIKLMPEILAGGLTAETNEGNNGNYRGAASHCGVLIQPLFDSIE